LFTKKKKKKKKNLLPEVQPKLNLILQPT